MAQERDREGEFDEFYRAYAGDVKAYCLRRADAPLADDALAETFALTVVAGGAEGDHLESAYSV